MKKIATYLFLSIFTPTLTFAKSDFIKNKDSEVKINTFSPIFKKATIDSMHNLIDRLNEENIDLKTAGIAFDFDDTLAHRVVKFPTLIEDVLFSSEITRDRAEQFYKLIKKFQIIDDPIPQNQIEYEQYLKKGMTITRNKVLAAALQKENTFNINNKVHKVLDIKKLHFLEPVEENLPNIIDTLKEKAAFIGVASVMNPNNERLSFMENKLGLDRTNYVQGANKLNSLSILCKNNKENYQKLTHLILVDNYSGSADELRTNFDDDITKQHLENLYNQGIIDNNVVIMGIVYNLKIDKSKNDINLTAQYIESLSGTDIPLYGSSLGRWKPFFPSHYINK